MSVAARFHKYCKHHGIDVDKKLPYGAITSFMTDHIVWTAKILQGLGPRLGSSGSYRVDCDNSTDLLTQGPRRKGTTLTQAADVQRHGAVVMWCRMCDCCGPDTATLESDTTVWTSAHHRDRSATYKPVAAFLVGVSLIKASALRLHERCWTARHAGVRLHGSDLVAAPTAVEKMRSAIMTFRLCVCSCLPCAC